VFFGGAPLWQASAAIWSRVTGRPKSVSSWTDTDHERAEKAVEAVMRGIGINDQMATETGDICKHFRRRCTALETDSVFKTPRGRAAALRHERGE
jgi:hypothetical protein